VSEVPLYPGGDAEREGVAAGGKHPSMSHEPASGLEMVRVQDLGGVVLQGYLAHKKTPPPLGLS